MKTNIFHKFNSIIELSNYLDNATTQPAFADHVDKYGSGKPEKREDWYGTPNYQFSRDLLLYGDPNTAARVNAAGLRQTIAGLQGRAPRTQQFTDIVGGAPCVPNYLVGRPDSMYNTRRPITTHPVVNVVYNCSASAGVSPEQITAAAAAVLGACVILENNGARVNLWVTELVTESGAPDFGAVVKIKDCSQKINLRKIAYTICHPSFLRRQMFRLLEVTPNVPSSYVWGYGIPCHDNDRITKQLNAVGVRDAVILNHKTTDTPEQIARNIAATLKRK